MGCASGPKIGHLAELTTIMSISPQLQSKFKILEMAIFPAWKKAGPKERERICKELGEFEANEIIREISEEANRKFPKTNG